MRVDCAFLPSELTAGHLENRAVVVFDVLRATTTITTALEAGVKEILVFPDIESVRQSKLKTPGAIACGEQQCLKPDGFDSGNSPGDFGSSYAGKTLLMCTTNGTKAILAARGAARIFTGALVNARAVAEQLGRISMDVTLLCAGTNGKQAMEDIIGAGAVIDWLGEKTELSEQARFALEQLRRSRRDLVHNLRMSDGGQNLLRAKLERDIDFAARLSIFTAVGEVKAGEAIRIVRVEH